MKNYTLQLLCVILFSSCNFQEEEFPKIKNTPPMETLEEIKNYDLSTYDSSKVQNSKDNIKGLLADCETIWNEWKSKNNSNSDRLELDIDFDFYSADKNGATVFASVLYQNGYKTKLQSKRTLIIFKGYEVRTTSKRQWTLKELKYEIERLGLVGLKYNCLIEGYGSLIKKN